MTVSLEGLVMGVGGLLLCFFIASLYRSRSHLEVALRANAAEKETIEQLVESSIDGIRLIDNDGVVIAGNSRMAEMVTGLTGIPATGTFWEQAAVIARQTTDPAAYEASIEEMREHPDRDVMYEFELMHSGRVFQRFTRPIRNAADEQTGRIIVLREMTGERELQRMKDDFVATVTHELRTPLTSIAGYLELLLEAESLGGEPRTFLEIIDRNSKRLLRLVNDLLFVARVDSDALELELGVVDLTKLLEEAVWSARPTAEAAGLSLALSAGSLSSGVADGPKLSQLIDNLVSNAMKFTPRGGRVDVNATTTCGKVLIEIADTGIGVPDGEKPHLFERFFRASTAIGSATPGTGLGLAITRAIAEAHRGSISVSDTPGGGTTFMVELPVAMAVTSDLAAA